MISCNVACQLSGCYIKRAYNMSAVRGTGKDESLAGASIPKPESSDSDEELDVKQFKVTCTSVGRGVVGTSTLTYVTCR